MRRSMFVLLAVPLLLGACSEFAGPAQPEDDRFTASGAATWVALDKPCPADAPAYSLPAALRNSPPARSHQDWNGRMAEIAREVPGGWGGLFYASSPESAANRTPGALTMYLVDPTKREEAIAALRPLLASATTNTSGGQIFPDIANAQVRQGRWDLVQLYDWYLYLIQHVSRAGSVQYHYSEIAVSRNRIEFGVLDESARQRLTERLKELDVPCFLVAVEIRPQARLAR